MERRNCSIRGSMKNGKNYYKLYTGDGRFIVGVFELGKLIVVAMELDKANGAPVKSFDEYSATVWDYSNGKNG